ALAPPAAPSVPQAAASPLAAPAPGLPPLSAVEFTPDGTGPSGNGRQAGWELALKVAAAGLRNRDADVARPEIHITAYGADGGEGRARVVHALFTGQLNQALDLLQGPPAEGTARLTAQDFAVSLRGAPGGPSDEVAALAGVPRAELARQVTVGITLSRDAVAMERLAALHEQDRRFRGKAFDVDVLARRMLHLPKDAPVDQAVRTELFGLVWAAEAKGRAGSLTALGAFHLDQLGAAGPGHSTYFTKQWKQIPGVSWLGRDVMGAMGALELDTDLSEVLVPQPDGKLTGSGTRRATPWPKGSALYVVAGDRRDDMVVARLPDESTRDADVEEIIELETAAVERAGLPPGTLIVLAVPFLGQYGVLLQQFAERTGLEVWAHSGEVSVSTWADGTGSIDTVAGRPGVPIGDWASFPPGQGPVPDESVPDWYLDVVMWPVISEAMGEQTGYASFEPGQYARNYEKIERISDRMPTFVHYHFPTDTDGPEQELPRPGPEGSPFPLADAFRISAHGVPGYMMLAFRSGNGVVSRFVDEAAGVAWVKWLVSRRPKVGWIDFSDCWLGTPKDSNSRGPAMRSPFAPEVFVADPLRELSMAKRTANDTDLWVRAFHGQLSDGEQPGTNRQRWVLYTDSQGQPRDVALERPDPKGAKLGRYVVMAGLHWGPGSVLAEVEERTRIAVRALQSMFGVHVEDRAHFGELLRGVAAVDEMWLADPEFRRVGPLTLDLVRRVIAAHAGPGVEVDQDVARDALVAAAAWWEARPRGPRGERVDMPWDFVDLPVVRLGAQWVQGDEARSEAATVLNLPEPRPLGEAERLRMLWAWTKTMDLLNTPGTDVDELAVRVLHLDPDFDVDESERAELRETLTRAFAVGRDASDPDVAAAYDLEVFGAFDETRIATVQDGVQGSGRDFTGESWPGVNLARIHTPGGLVDAPWRNRNRNRQAPALRPLLLRADPDPLDPDTVRLTIHNQLFQPPVGEFLELAAVDPALTERKHGTEVVFSHADWAPDVGAVAQRLAQRLGRPVWWTEDPTDLSDTDDQGVPVLTAFASAGSGPVWHLAVPKLPPAPIPLAPHPVPRPYPLPGSTGPAAPATASAPTISTTSALPSAVSAPRAPHGPDADGAVALHGDQGAAPVSAPWMPGRVGWDEHIETLDGARAPVAWVRPVPYRNASGAMVGVSLRGAGAGRWLHRERSNGPLPDVDRFTEVRWAPDEGNEDRASAVLAEGPPQRAPFGRVFLVGIDGDGTAAWLRPGPGAAVAFGYAQVADYLLAHVPELTRQPANTAVLVVGADVAGPHAPGRDPLEWPVAGQVLADGMPPDQWVWTSAQGLEVGFATRREPDGHGGSKLVTVLRLTEGDWLAGFRPEPSPAQLAEVAERVTGDPGRAGDVQRWWRVVRLVYGPLLENDEAAFEAVLHGFRAVDQCRADRGDTSPLTRDALRAVVDPYMEAVNARFTEAGHDPVGLWQGLLLTLVAAAGEIGMELELHALDLAPRYAPVRAWEEAPESSSWEPPVAPATGAATEPSGSRAPVSPAAPLPLEPETAEGLEQLPDALPLAVDSAGSAESAESADPALASAWEAHAGAWVEFAAAVAGAASEERAGRAGDEDTLMAGLELGFWAAAELARERLEEAEARLRALGVPLEVVAAARGAAGEGAVAPVVPRDEAQRWWIAGQLTEEDAIGVAAQLVANAGDGLDRADVQAAGVTPVHDPWADVEMMLGGADDRVPVDALSLVDLARVLMVRPGPWVDALDDVAANVSLRLWASAYADFAGAGDAAPVMSPDGAMETDVARAWAAAVSLVLPVEPHAVLADSRYAGEGFRGAVRSVAENLLMWGPETEDALRSAAELADVLRPELGLRPRWNAPAADGAGPGDSAPPVFASPAPSSPASPVPASPASPAPWPDAPTAPVAPQTPVPARPALPLPSGSGAASGSGQLPAVRPLNVDVTDLVSDAWNRHARAWNALVEASADFNAACASLSGWMSRDRGVLRARVKWGSARKKVEVAESRLWALGVSLDALAGARAAAGEARHVPSEISQRRWVADELTEEDVESVAARLAASGSTDPGTAEVRAAGVAPVERARTLMVSYGPWRDEAKEAAANVSRRLWASAYEAFAGAAPGGAVAADVARAWDTAVFLVLPPEPHAPLSDHRYAVEEYRNAVRQVAEHLLTSGPGTEAALRSAA
ncbi:MAG: lonely Cys domain-containing protein, partial [Streptomyces sp.]|nr:lonely Cys domain-containing protein [Streptomyces sp.]